MGHSPRKHFFIQGELIQRPYMSSFFIHYLFQLLHEPAESLIIPPYPSFLQVLKMVIMILTIASNIQIWLTWRNFPILMICCWEVMKGKSSLNNSNRQSISFASTDSSLLGLSISSVKMEFLAWKRKTIIVICFHLTYHVLITTPRTPQAWAPRSHSWRARLGGYPGVH